MILQVKNVFYTYGSGDILKDINAKFEPGVMYAILGPSGSGKTTLLSLLAGLDVPTKGEVIYNNKPLIKRELNAYRRHCASLVFQSYNLIDYLTAKENVMLSGTKSPMKFLDMMNIPDADRNRGVLKLSGGQQQRVAIARALASDGDILLADEPTGNLDSTTSKEIVNILKDCAHKQNKCVIVVTHSLELANDADVVIEMKED